MAKIGKGYIGLIISVNIVLLVALLSGVFWVWAIFARYPGSFMYTEARYFDYPQEAAILTAAETFDYSAIPTTMDEYISNMTLYSYYIRNITWNPFYTVGSTWVYYIGNVTHFSSLDISLNLTAIDEQPDHPIVFESNGTLVRSVSWDVAAMGGYLSGQNYEGYEWDRYEGYRGSASLMISYTDVFFVEMQLTISQEGAGSQSFFGDADYIFQEVILDSAGNVLFVSWHKHFLVWI